MSTQAILTLLIGIVVAAINTYIGVKIKNRDADTRKYRDEREKKEEEFRSREEKMKKLSEDSTRSLIRVELRENYFKCKRKGYYSNSDKEVFHPLFEIYKDLDGDGIVDQWREELIRMPTDEPFGHKVKRILLRQSKY